METKLEKEVRSLRIYAVVATFFCAIFLLSGFVMQSKRQKFEEIDVERINVMEKDGKLRMVISNAQRQHPGSVDGKIIPREGGRPAGMIFFNERGDEVGGLIFSGDTGKERFGSLTFDKFRGDQTIAFQHLENIEGNYFAGLSFNDENMTTTDRMATVEAIKSYRTKQRVTPRSRKCKTRANFWLIVCQWEEGVINQPSLASAIPEVESAYTFQ